MTHDYDIAIIGAGSAGLTGAGFAARMGAKVALVERDRIGGDCTWTGCVPSKALIRAARAAHEVRTVQRFGIDVPPPTVDMSGVRDHVRRAIRTIYDAESPDVLRDDGMDVIEAAATFLDPHTLSVDGGSVTARTFLLCTGAQPIVPPVPGLDAVPYHTHETIFENDRLPRHLMVVGAGPIGVELGQAYRRLGAEVSLVAPVLLPREEPEVRAIVRAALTSEGVRIVEGRVDAVHADQEEHVLHCGEEELRGDMLLIAVGRRPNVEGLGLDRAGVDYGADGVVVDGFLRTTAPHIYAAGDVTGAPQFTHLAGWQGFRAVRNALLPGKDDGMPAVLPRVTFLDPEVACAGLVEDEARARFGDDVRIHRWQMDDSDRAIVEDRTAGFIKVVADSHGRVLGVSIVAERAGEMLSEFTLAMDQGFDLTAIAESVHAYPTWSTPIQLLASVDAVERFLSSLSGQIARKVSGLKG